MQVKTTKNCTALKPVFVTPHGKLYQADCLELLTALPDESVNTVFADPPFNIGKDYNNGRSDSIDDGSYLDWCKKWMNECIRLIKPGGSFFIYIMPRWGYQFAAHLEDQGLEFRHWIALTMKGTFPRGRKLYPAHYAILYFSKGDPATFNRLRTPIPLCRHCGGEIKDYGGHRNKLNPAGLNLADFWEDTSPARHRKNKSRWHINELKPIIPERCILLSTRKGDTVLDPFGGGGSTFVVAEYFRRKWIGCEIGPVEPILERFQREFPFLTASMDGPTGLQPQLSPLSSHAPHCPNQTL